MSQGEVEAFEKKYGVTLPTEYRAFLIRVGNGGLGPPDRGMNKLVDPPALPDPGGPGSAMDKPFVFTKPWIWEEGDLSQEGTREQVSHGNLYLGTDGCGMNWVLIVTGAERGNIWQIVDVGMQPTVPRRDFLTWVEDWLDGEEDWWGVEG